MIAHRYRGRLVTEPPHPQPEHQAAGLPERPNLVLLITDQQRQPQHWPEDPAWLDELCPQRRRAARGLA